MNMIDIALVLIVAISVAFAVYRGFLASALAVVACFVSLGVALLAGPTLANALRANQGITSLLITFTDADSLIGDSTLANTPVAALSPDTLENILKTVSLPPVVQQLLRGNIQTQAFSSQGIYMINAYVSATIVSVLLTAGSFLLCFFLSFLALHILINLVDHVFYFPVLRHLELPAAAVMGFIRGVIVVYILLIIVPLVRTVIPFDTVEEYISASRLLPLFHSESLLLRILAG